MSCRSCIPDSWLTIRCGIAYPYGLVRPESWFGSGKLRRRILLKPANPMRYSSFRDYLGEVGYGSVDVDLKAGIQTIQSWGLLPNEDESLYEYEQRRVDDPCTPARSMMFADDELTTLLAIGYARNILEPKVSHRQMVTNTNQRIQSTTSRLHCFYGGYTLSFY